MSDASAKESDRYAIAVIGAGPAGIAAAAVAAESGQRVIVLDECPAPGGQIWRHPARGNPPDLARTWISRLERSTATVRTGTAVIDLRRLGDANFQLHVVREGVGSLVRASRVILSTGARELFLPFPGWTLPGVIGVGAAQTLLKSGLTVRDQRVVVTGSGPLLFPVAAALHHAGARLQLVAEQAEPRAVYRYALGLWSQPAILAQAIRYRSGFLRAPYRTGTWIAAAEGNRKLERVTLTNGRKPWTIECDLLCSAFGLVPNLELARLAGCRLQDGFVATDDEQETSVEGVYAAGEPTGIGGVDMALAEGMVAGYAAAGRSNEAMPGALRRERLRKYVAELTSGFQLRPELKKLATPDTLVCRCEDVRLGALQPEWTMRQAKLYTRVGMGACQGRVCGAALQHLCGWTPEVPHAPIEPVPVSALL
ncbi:MAG: FAD/NAD(P)-binding oxidoreductase [Gemmatimonadota bacterium]